MIILCIYNYGYLARFEWLIFWFFRFWWFDGIMISFCTPLSSRSQINLKEGRNHNELTGMFKNSVKSVLLFLQQDHPYVTYSHTQMEGILHRISQTHLHCVMKHWYTRMMDTCI